MIGPELRRSILSLNALRIRHSKEGQGSNSQHFFHAFWRAISPVIKLVPVRAQAVADFPWGGPSVSLIAWSATEDGKLSLRWVESGGPIVTPPMHRGFGTRITENMISQLKGEVRFDWRAKVLICEIVSPLDTFA
jgi:hypothetical protein